MTKRSPEDIALNIVEMCSAWGVRLPDGTTLQELIIEAIQQAKETQMPSREESTKRAKEVWGPNGDTLFISGWKSCYDWLAERMK